MPSLRCPVTSVASLFHSEPGTGGRSRSRRWTNFPDGPCTGVETVRGRWKFVLCGFCAICASCDFFGGDGTGSPQGPAWRVPPLILKRLVLCEAFVCFPCCFFSKCAARPCDRGSAEVFVLRDRDAADNV
mmetsp:Transcript_801/g.1923  ORF Transcript_801/g.1923 Transcript_801/m.1923 type:complete len:130 (-) Transcript_801:14-403(-)